MFINYINSRLCILVFINPYIFIGAFEKYNCHNMPIPLIAIVWHQQDIILYAT